MPIYEYRCSSCGHELEALQKFSDAPLAACPSCQRRRAGQAAFPPPASSSRAAAGTPRTSRAAAKPAPAKDDGTSANAGCGRKPDAKAESKSRVRRATGETGSKSESARRRRARAAAPAEDRRHRLPPRSIARAPATNDEALPDRRPARLGAARHHDLGDQHFLVTTLDQTLLLVPEGAAARGALRLSHSRARRPAELRDPARSRASSRPTSSASG